MSARAGWQSTRQAIAGKSKASYSVGLAGLGRRERFRSEAFQGGVTGVDAAYDVVTIGAGLGGLSAATLLAKKGHRVLVLERHNIAGGYATSFVRGRYEMEVSLHVLSDVGTPENPGSLRRYLDALGVSRHVELVTVPSFARSVFPGLDLELPGDRLGFEATLCRAFPASAVGIRRFLDRVVAVSQEADGLSDSFALPRARRILRAATIPLRLRAIPRYLFATLGDVLERDVDDPRARALLCQAWSYVGLPPSSASFIFYAATLGSLLRHSPAYPRTRSQGLSNAFAATLRSFGGELRLGCGVRRIEVAGGRVTGVETDQGERVRARMVVSNVSPIATYRDLMRPEDVPPAALAAMRACPVGISIFQVYLGVARSAPELGIRGHETMLNESFDVEAHYRRGLTFERPGHMLFCCPNVVVPEVSPQGTSLVTLSAMTYGRPWVELAPERYHDTKRQLADQMLGWAEEHTPGLRDAIEVVEVGSPLTMMRYAGHPYGAIYGFENFPVSHTMLRPPPIGPLRGLFFAGAWTNPGGGYWPAISSGQITGEIASAMLERRPS
jgi:prolycopene isomerase